MKIKKKRGYCADTLRNRVYIALAESVVCMCICSPSAMHCLVQQDKPHFPSYHYRITSDTCTIRYSRLINLLNPTGHVMHQQFNIQQLYALPTLYLRVLYLSENKQRLVPLTA